MLSTNTQGLSSERLKEGSNVDLNDIQCSAICGEILWKPVSCQNCETHFCSRCIQQWHVRNPGNCPLRCATYTERPCSKFVSRQLAKLQVKCIYKPNGCTEVISYEALEKHEADCQFQCVNCTNCFENVSKASLNNHMRTCSQSCSQNGTSHNTFPSAPREMNESNGNIDRRYDTLLDLLISNGLLYDNRPGKIQRVELQSSEEMNRIDKNRLVHLTGALDTILCSSCNHILLKPTSCKNCQSVFCYKCSPWSGFIGGVLNFFGRKTTHGTKGCQNFEEGAVPDLVMNQLRITKIRCCYSRNGCPEECLHQNLLYHEATCSFESNPCTICKHPISKRRSFVEHSKKECFERMLQKSSTPIQHQMMFLFKALEESRAENSRLNLSINELRQQIKTLDSQCVKKPPEKTTKP